MRLSFVTVVISGLLWNIQSHENTHFNWQLQSLDVPPSHIPFYVVGKPNKERFCEKGNSCKVRA